MLHFFRKLYVSVILFILVFIAQGEDFAVLFDAGSTGTRVYIYKWISTNPLETIEEVTHKRVHPG